MRNTVIKNEDKNYIIESYEKGEETTTSLAKKLGYKECVNKGCEAVLKIMKKKRFQ